jgi:SPP1 gp7 family putative phage head morphogenesis protein
LQVHIDVEGRRDVVNVVSRDAEAYARSRSAELVGRRRDELGRLVDNPNAEWAITESTRDGVRQYVESAITDGWSNAKLAEELSTAYAFSKERSMVIARTETNMASNRGALNGYKASGVVSGVEWLTADDDRVSEECEANGDAGVLPVGAEFPSGDTAPPSHSNCRCSLSPVVTFDTSAQADSGEDDE